ncbi:MAG: hypothetical protein WHT46_04070 [Candidatus Geothermincolales bacterium]
MIVLVLVQNYPDTITYTLPETLACIAAISLYSYPARGNKKISAKEIETTGYGKGNAIAIYIVEIKKSPRRRLKQWKMASVVDEIHFSHVEIKKSPQRRLININDIKMI